MNFVFNAKNRLTVNGDLVMGIYNYDGKSIGEINFIDIELGFEISEKHVNEWKIEIGKVVVSIDNKNYDVNKYIGQDLWREFGEYTEETDVHFRELTDFIERNPHDFDKANELIDKLNEKGGTL